LFNSKHCNTGNYNKKKRDLSQKNQTQPYISKKKNKTKQKTPFKYSFFVTFYFTDEQSTVAFNLTNSIKELSDRSPSYLIPVFEPFLKNKIVG